MGQTLDSLQKDGKFKSDLYGCPTAKGKTLHQDKTGQTQDLERGPNIGLREKDKHRTQRGVQPQDLKRGQTQE